MPFVTVVILLSGSHFSLRREYLTALFGWSTAISITAIPFVLIFGPNSPAVSCLLQIAGFCLITALSRGYEKVLRPMKPMFIILSSKAATVILALNKARHGDAYYIAASPSFVIARPERR